VTVTGSLRGRLSWSPTAVVTLWVAALTLRGNMLLDSPLGAQADDVLRARAEAVAGSFRCAAVDQLGHANTSMTSDVYFGRKIAAIGAAAVLRALSSYARSSLAPVRHLNAVGLNR
jgi:hypothetical protein